VAAELRKYRQVLLARTKCTYLRAIRTNPDKSVAGSQPPFPEDAYTRGSCRLPTVSDKMAGMRWAFAFFYLAVSALAAQNLDVLLNAAASFSITINQQLQMLHGNPSVSAFAEKTIDYAEAKAAYFEALRAALPILAKAPAGEQAQSAGKFAAALAVAEEEQQKIADKETSALFARFSNDPRLEKARISFERAQKAEQNFHKDYDALGFGDQ